MRRNIYITILLASCCMIFSSCKFEVFTHTYESGSSYEEAYTNIPLAPGAIDDDGDGGSIESADEGQSANLGNFSWEGLLDFIWSKGVSY